MRIRSLAVVVLALAGCATPLSDVEQSLFDSYYDRCMAELQPGFQRQTYVIGHVARSAEHICHQRSRQLAREAAKPISSAR